MFMGKEFMRRVARCSVALMVGAFILCLPVCVYGNSIAQKQSEISGAKQDKKNLEQKVQDLEDARNELLVSKQNLTSYVTKLDSELTMLQMKINELNNLVDEKKEQIEETKKELDEAKREEGKQYVQMKRRIRFMYEKSESSYYQMLFNAESFSDFLNHATYIEQITSYDRQMLVAYQQTKETIALLKANLEDEEEILQAAMDEAKQNEGQMESLISDKQKEIEKYEGDIKDKEAAIKEYEAQIAERDATIKALEKAVAAAIAAASSVSGNKVIKYKGGVFAWPVPNYTRISSDYGNRMHPILGVQKFHSGIDLAAPSGSAILAAADGEVVAAAYNASMGNYVMINHGDSIFTIYMHCSALYVSQGTSVTKGQSIAAVGSTGRSTGPHLHFSVRVGGNYVSPWSYLGR